MASTLTPPHWNLDALFPGIDTPEFREALTEIETRIDALRALFDRYGIEARPTRELRETDVEALEALIEHNNALSEKVRALTSFLYAHIATDASNELAQGKSSEVDLRLLPLSQLDPRFTAWIGSVDLEALLAASTLARSHEFLLRKRARRAQHQMSPAEEGLAVELSLTGGSAWSKLHGDVSSQLSVAFGEADKPETLPMSEIRNLAHHADRDVRRTAYHAELAAWKGIEIPMAAALNSIKGETNLLAKRRRWESALDASLFSANIDRPTLEAMMQAAEESFPTFRRYLHAKAHALGLDRLAWFDLFAPVESEEDAWSYGRATEFVERHFRGYSPHMGDFAARAFREEWVDAEPRKGKRDGAFCMGIGGADSRILMNFKPSFGAVSTLAHELGHGYHNLCLANRTPLNRNTPMTLAETASIFCETIIRDAGVREGSESEKLAILEASLQGSCQVVVDISSRFRFEQAIFERREDRELAPSEFCQIMLDAQRATYGDGLDQDFLHGYMWAVKGHYYGTRVSFYNYPYMYGLLFALGLYEAYRSDPTGFVPLYDELLASTGEADAATLGARFGIDVRSVEFWRSSLAKIAEDVDRYCALVGYSN